MAAVIGALRVNLAANIAKFEQDLGKAAKQVAKVQRRFDQFGKRATAAGQALSVGLTAPLVAVGALSAKSFLSFERGMNRVAAVSGATESEMATLTQIAKDLGATTSFSAAQAAEGLGFLAQAGFEAAEAGAALPGVLQLAAAGGIELAEAADIATNVLAGYALEVDQLGRVNDVLAKASSSANTDVLQLGQAFKFAGPVAASAGVSFETSAAAMALMGNAGIQAEMAGTALRGAIAKLVNPSKEAAGTMAELGISATDSTGRLLPLDQIIEQLAPHADNTGAIMQIFGQRAGPAMSALVSQGADALRDMTVALEQSGGTAQEIADKKLAGLTGAWTKLQSATEGVLIEIGSRLAPVLERIAAVLTDSVLPAVQGMLDAFGRLSPAAQANRLLWLGMAAAIGPALLAFGGIARAISPLVPAFSAVWMAAGRMSNALVGAMIHPIATAQKLRARIGALRGSFTGLSVSARASAVGVRLASVALTGFRFAVRGVIAALGPLALVFAAFEFATWAAGALDLGGKLKRLMGITDDTADSARDADAAYEGLNQTLRARAVVEATTQLADLQRQLAEQIERLETAEATRNRRAVIRAKREIAALERKIVVQEEAVEVAQAAVESEQAAARASEEYTAALAAVREEAAGITDATSEQIKAARKLGISLKELSERFGISEKALEIYLDQLDEADNALGDVGEGLRGAGEDTDAFTGQVDNLVGRLGGDGAIQQAKAWAAAVGEVGGLTRMTAGETDELARVLEAALEKYRLLGTRAPAAIRELAEETIAARRRIARDAMFDAQLEGGLPTALPTLPSTSLAGALTVPLQVRPNIDMGALKSFGDRFQDFGMHVSQTFVRAFEGGGGVKGAFGALGTQALSGFGDLATKAFGEGSKIGNLLSSGLFSAIPVIGPFLSAFGGPLIAGLGKIGKKIGGFFKGLFGGPSERELGGRKAVASFQKDVVSGFEWTKRYQDELQEHISQGWDRTLAQFHIAVKHQFIAAGRTDQEAAQVVGRLWDAIKRGPEAVAAVQTEIEAVIGTAADLKERNLEIARGLEGIRDAGIEAFNPEQIEPYLAQLLEAGLLTAEQADELRGLADEAQIDWQAMQSAAERYGVELSALGPAFDEARISDGAMAIVRDFELLTGEGADVNGVLAGMQDEVQALVSDALNAGAAIPEGMRPIIESLVEQGELTDENGNLLTDVSRLDFASPIVEKFDTLIDKLTELIDQISGRGGVTEAIEAIPRDVGINVGFNVEQLQLDIPSSIEIPGHIFDIPHLATGGLVTRPTLAMLGERGRPEVVAPLDRLESLIGGADRGTASDRPAVIQVRLPDDTLLVEHIIRRMPEALEALGRV